MSRSYKKAPRLGVIENKSYKKIFNRRIRRAHLTDTINNGGSYKKLNERYNLCDYEEFCSWDEFQRKNLNKYLNKKEAFVQWWKWYKQK